MTSYEKYEKVREFVNAEDLCEHFAQWLDSDTLDEIMEDVIKDNDLDYFYPENFC